MNSLNSILLEGNVWAREQIMTTSKGTKTITFWIASNRMFKFEDEIDKEVSFFEITTCGKLAEICNEYLDHVKRVRVMGRLRQNRWKDGQGKGHAKVQIVADHIDFQQAKDMFPKSVNK